ncbi:response regulator transcription factor [Clostridium sp. BL-8]|uniref:response regulator transcription factor n=1 Tax=Clostridium sp. BL-8 TaxID=349938 RepID=UPI00098C3FA1|nr:response regulator transcription factor [Clostridium sp. BL-8]OOM80674.1 transcriptional regulatory protein WalR [Clostridium sp. BL-8]
MNILIADDELYMLKILKAYFEKENYKVFLSKDGEEALDIFYNNKIDIAVLDWMMPKKNGIEVCKEIKEKSSSKVVMLTAKNENEDELKALNIGADEYIKKPFDPRILLVRVKKLLNIENIIISGNIKVDLKGKKMFKDEVDLNLTKKEFQLIQCLYENRGMILTRKQLLDIIWGLDYFGEERTVDTHIRRLREKIGEELIKTHRGMGYSLELKDE